MTATCTAARATESASTTRCRPSSLGPVMSHTICTPRITSHDAAARVVQYQIAARLTRFAGGRNRRAGVVSLTPPLCQARRSRRRWAQLAFGRGDGYGRRAGVRLGELAAAHRGRAAEAVLVRLGGHGRQPTGAVRRAVPRALPGV